MFTEDTFTLNVELTILQIGQMRAAFRAAINSNERLIEEYPDSTFNEQYAQEIEQWEKMSEMLNNHTSYEPTK
jgi:divalent metal cation (Fe/Co/Zn/Cd) transporter